MAKTKEFYTPRDIGPLYTQIIPAYQSAFSGEPWYEVSKCGGCASGFSPSTPGGVCERCGSELEEIAYTSTELTARFIELGETRPTMWYVEQEDTQVTLGAVAWQSNVSDVIKEKYKNDDMLRTWFATTLGAAANNMIWLDEVFANRMISNTGNLANFREMIEGFFDRLDGEAMAYRTITPAMKRAPIRDFGDRALLYAANSNVPDYRDVMIITKE